MNEREMVKLVDLDLMVKIETPRAWLVTDGDKEAWLPKSQCQNNGDGTFTVPHWLAKDKELI